jgi:sterol desaturase/sphingolipid hydroxylase (fatty acid hydroxylase superfamily)
LNHLTLRLARGPVLVTLATLAAVVAAFANLAIASGWYLPLADAVRAVLRPLREPDVVDVYLNPLLWLLFGAIPVLEWRFPAKSPQPILSVGFLQDAVYFAISTVFRVGVLSFYVAALRLFYDRYLAFLTIEGLVGQPLTVRALLMILVTDLLAWLHHYVRHRVVAFWHFHTVHHSQRQMNLFTDVRVHPVERVVAQTIQFVPLMMIEQSFPVLTAYVLFHQWYTKLYHANIRGNFGPLRYLLVTPQSHRIHHSFDPRHYNRNFGVIFSIWDHLFGTQYRRYDEYPDTGLPDADFPYEQAGGTSGLLRSTMSQLIYPFRLLLADRGGADENPPLSLRA